MARWLTGKQTQAPQMEHRALSPLAAGGDLIVLFTVFLFAGFWPPQTWQPPAVSGFALAFGCFALLRAALGQQALRPRNTVLLGLCMFGVALLGFYGPFAALPRTVAPQILMGAAFGLVAILCCDRLSRLSAPYSPLAQNRGVQDRGLLGLLLDWQAVAAVLLLNVTAAFLIFDAPLGLGVIAHVELMALCVVTLRNFVSVAVLARQSAGRLRSVEAVSVLVLGLFALSAAVANAASLDKPGIAAMLALLLASALLALVATIRTARAAAACATALCAALGEISSYISADSDPITEVVTAAALTMVLFALNRFGHWGLGGGFAGLADGQRFQAAEGCWLGVADMGKRTVTFPLSGEGILRDVPFSQLFGQAELPPLMDLFGKLATPPQEAQAEDDDPPLLTIAIPGQPSTPMRVRVLDRQENLISLSFVADHFDRSLIGKLRAAETGLAEARQREEHLLAVASHELRTPVAILTMLVEDMKSGSSWDEIGISMESTVRRLTGIMENLRAQTDGPGRGEIFTLAEIGLQLLETFNSSATGLRLRLEQSQNAETLLQGAPVRIIVALSKLVHNAIVHSQGSEVVIASFLTLEENGSATVTWTIRDNGKGIAPDIRERLFIAFGGEGTGDATTGLGLYYARKSIGMIGGKLWLDEAVTSGTCFVMTHPVRPVRDAEPDEEEKRTKMAENTIPYPSKSALLVEDNKLVGELTANRLRKLFGTVVWVENGTDALDRFRAAPQSIIFVDQLLPGMTGAELVEQIRHISATVPIIGITASTLGSECERLEAAGVNIAIEKPLSFDQTKLLARQFLGAEE